jgi:phenylacetate-coenzyme A ligase PaaK-like adenylate-forming protein
MKVSSRRVLSVIAVAVLFVVVPAASSVASAQSGGTSPSPDQVLRSARAIFIRTKSVYFNPSTLEHALLQHDELRQWGLAVTRDESEADLVIEVRRKLFTTSFVYSVIDPKRQTVVASGRVNSIGGTVEGKITHSLMQKLRAAHQH